MAVDFLDTQEKPQELWIRLVRIAKLLIMIALLVLLDGFNRNFSLMTAFDQLPSTLYDFTVKYREPLTKWYRASTKSSNTQTVIVRFEKQYKKQNPLTPGYVSLTDVPFLEAYLNEHLPSLSSGSRRFLGYDMAFPIYGLLVSFVPSALLIAFAWRLERLRRLWLSSGSSSSRLVSALPLFSHSNKRTHLDLPKALIASVVLFVVTLLPPIMLISHQLMLQPAIKGALNVEPLDVASIQDPHTLLIIRGLIRDDLTPIWLMLLDIIAFGFILRTLMSRKLPAKQ